MSEMTIEEMEAETARINAELAKRNPKKRSPNKTRGNGTKGSVAERFPARGPDDNGKTWYKTEDSEAGGWTSQLERAHPDYRKPNAPAPLPPRQSRDGEILVGIQQDQRCKTAVIDGATRKFMGPTLIEKIQAQMDRRRKALAQMIIDNGAEVRVTPEYIVNKGRYEGFAATLAILRDTSVKQEIARSNERLGIE